MALPNKDMMETTILVLRLGCDDHIGLTLTVMALLAPIICDNGTGYSKIG